MLLILPLQPRRHEQVFRRESLGADDVTEMSYRSASADMGDMSHIMATLRPYLGGGSRRGRGADLRTTDPRLACVGHARPLALMAAGMLRDDAGTARSTIGDLTPRATTDAQGAFPRGIKKTRLHHVAR
jgi:hypothetical protein